MSFDFCLSTYVKLLNAIKDCNYRIIPVEHYSYVSDEKVLILRHDVDRMPKNALKMALVEAEIGIRSSYYFRIRHEEKYCKYIKRISDMGHEIGYHYEELNTIISQKKNYPRILYNTNMSTKEEEQILNESYKLFSENLEKLRKIANICTITMHGSPISRYDNRILWKKYSYKELGIIIEPYFDIDWDLYTYLTDTGRKWNADRCNIRDRIVSKRIISYRTSKDIIKNANLLPKRLIITVHPERWTNNILGWINQLVIQNIKNVIKIILFKNFYYVQNDIINECIKE